MALSVACSAALLTPIATPVNLIAMGAAGYRFGDYWKLGILVMGVFFVVAVFLVPRVLAVLTYRREGTAQGQQKHRIAHCNTARRSCDASAAIDARGLPPS